MDESKPKVKCADCGFLVSRNQHTGKCEGFLSKARENGELDPSVQLTTHTYPECFLEAFDLFKEHSEHPVKNDAKKRLLEVITRDRDCPKFCQWHPGNSPQQHVMIAETKAIQEANERSQREMRAWTAEQKRLDEERQDRLKKEEREWQEKQEKDKREWQEKLEEKQERQKRRFHLWMTIISAVIAGVTAIVGFFGGRYFSGNTTAPFPPPAATTTERK